MSKPALLTPAKRGAELLDVEATEEGETAELIDGDLYLPGHPGNLHQFCLSALMSMLPQTAGIERFYRCNVRLGGDVLVPDLCACYAEDLPNLDSGNDLYVPAKPFWVCEVLSQQTGTVAHDRVRKRARYDKHEVRYLWLVDPVAYTLEAFENIADGWLLIGAYAGDEVACVPPFKEATLDLARLWGW